jgi:hypothetical protein
MNINKDIRGGIVDNINLGTGLTDSFATTNIKENLANAAVGDLRSAIDYNNKGNSNSNNSPLSQLVKAESILPVATTSSEKLYPMHSIECLIGPCTTTTTPSKTLPVRGDIPGSTGTGTADSDTIPCGVDMCDHQDVVPEDGPIEGPCGVGDISQDCAITGPSCGIDCPFPFTDPTNPSNNNPRYQPANPGITSGTGGQTIIGGLNQQQQLPQLQKLPNQDSIKQQVQQQLQERQMPIPPTQQQQQQQPNIFSNNDGGQQAGQILGQSGQSLPPIR